VDFGSGPPPAVAGPRFGVEEEFLVVDPRTRAAVPQAAQVLARARGPLGEQVSGELTKLQLETKTTPCRTVTELLGQLTGSRQQLAAAAREEDLRIMAAGTPVVGQHIPAPITEGQRQDEGNAMFRALHSEHSICAVHVHVEVPDRERALLISNHLRPFLPALLALTANSPYWNERDTGYASWRSLTYGRWPVAGPPPYFTSAAHYDELIATLWRAGGLVDEGTIFWDIRPSARYPTLEIRVADVPVTAAESALLAALVRGLVAVAGAAVDAGDPGPVISAELLRIAYWRAGRDGLSGSGIDVHTGALVPATELTARLLQAAQPDLAARGDLAQVTAWMDWLTAAGCGADRQRRATARRGQLADAVDYLIAATVGEHELLSAGHPGTEHGRV
jgi:carboxylate-amine ligase